MYRSKESAAFAELLAEVFPTEEERAAHEREVAELVAFIETQPQPRGRRHTPIGGWPHDTGHPRRF
jgi:hypothetical protein